MRLMCAFVLLSAAIVSSSPYSAAERIQEAGATVEPFRVTTASVRPKLRRPPRAGHEPLQR